VNAVFYWLMIKVLVNLDGRHMVSLPSYNFYIFRVSKKVLVALWASYQSSIGRFITSFFLGKRNHNYGTDIQHNHTEVRSYEIWGMTGFKIHLK
jgi:hypothetical protein